MQTLSSVIIEHTTAQGVHHDWLVEDAGLTWPKDPNSRLWTARVIPPPGSWSSWGRFELVVLPPHRRAYLDYQGPVSGNRGRVRRVGRGTVQPMLWSSGRMCWRVMIDGFDGVIDATRLSNDRWLAAVQSSTGLGAFMPPENRR